MTSGAGTVPPPPTRTSTVDRERVLHDLDQPGHVGGEQPAGLAHDDDAAVDQEGWGEAGVDDGADAQLVAGAAADLLDDERVVAVAHHLVEQPAHGLGHQGGVVALDQIRREHGAGRAHSASLTAASASRARQVPLTSCTRTMRQPQAMPRAAAPMEASRRSVSSRSRILPRKVLFDAESSSGIAQAGQGRRGAQEGQRLLGRLAEVEAGVEHDPLGRDAGGAGALGALGEEAGHVGHHVVVVRVGVGHPRGEADVRDDDGGAVLGRRRARSRGRPGR